MIIWEKQRGRVGECTSVWPEYSRGHFCLAFPLLITFIVPKVPHHNFIHFPPRRTWGLFRSYKIMIQRRQVITTQHWYLILKSRSTKNPLNFIQSFAKCPSTIKFIFRQTVSRAKEGLLLASLEVFLSRIVKLDYQTIVSVNYHIIRLLYQQIISLSDYCISKLSDYQTIVSVNYQFIALLYR